MMQVATMARGRPGRPRHQAAERQPDGRVRPEPVGPTVETLDRRIDLMAMLVRRHPRQAAKMLALDQDAGWYIGRLYLVGVVTKDQRDAAWRWRDAVRRYEILLMVPKRPGGLDLLRRGGADPNAGLDEEGGATAQAAAAFRRAKAAYDLGWNALADCGSNVLRATTAALRDEDVNLNLLRRGLDALVAA